MHSSSLHVAVWPPCSAAVYMWQLTKKQSNYMHVALCIDVRGELIAAIVCVHLALQSTTLYHEQVQWGTDRNVDTQHVTCMEAVAFFV